MSDSAPTWRATGVHWLLVVGIIAVVELLVSLGRPYPSPFERGQRFYPPTRVPAVEESTIQWQLDRLARTPTDVLLFGDSSAMMGLDPAIFVEETGARVQNFGTVSWLHTEGHADLLELYVERHGPPQVALYQMGTLIHVYPHDELTGTGLLDNYRSYLGVTEQAGPLPSMALRGWTRDVFEGRHYPAVYTEAPRGREPSDDWVRERLESHAGLNVDFAVRSNWDALGPLQALYRPTIESGLLRMFEVADAHGFPLFVVHAPIPDRFQNADRDAEYTHVEEQLSALAEPFPTVRVVGPFARYLPVAAFANFEHLTPAGARLNSLALAPLVANALGTAASPSPAEAPSPEASE